MNFISTKLGELYDKLLENQMRVDKNDMQKMRAHVVCVLHAQLPEHMHKAAKKYADRSKDKADSDKKRLDREQKFDELLQMYPKVALAVFFREMEERLISVCLARKEQMEQEYRRVRRGQQLTTLEDHVYNMKADLQKNGFAHLDSRMTQIFQQSKSKVKGNKVGSGSRGMQTGVQSSSRRRSNSSTHQSKNKTRGRARSASKADRSHSKNNQQRDMSTSAQNRQKATRTKSQTSKTSQRSARTSSTRGRSSAQQQASANRSSRSRQSQSSVRSMTSQQRSFSRNTSRSKSNRSKQGSRCSSRSKTSRATFT